MGCESKGEEKAERKREMLRSICDVHRINRDKNEDIKKNKGRHKKVSQLCRTECFKMV